MQLTIKRKPERLAILKKTFQTLGKKAARHLTHSNTKAFSHMHQSHTNQKNPWKKPYQNPRPNNLKRDNEKCYKCVWGGESGSLAI